VNTISQIRKILTLFIIGLFISMPFLAVVTADGGGWGSHHGQFFLLSEKEQYAVIGHDNGIERMLLSVNLNTASYNNAVWIFPVPSEAKNVNVDLANGAPTFYGSEIIEDAKDDIKDSATMALAAYAVLPPALLYVMVIGFGGGSSKGTVDVYKHLEKYGMTVEVISATEGNGIYKYLTDKDFSMSKGVVPQLDSYVKNGYSFVVTWWSGANSTIQPGVIINFPSDKIYYPLCLTSIYGDAVIPTNIFVMGYVTPNIYHEIHPYTTITYYKGSGYGNYYYRVSPEVQNFTQEIMKNKNGRFTKIDLNAPSKLFTNDLWIDDTMPFKPGYAEWIHDVLGNDSICCGIIPVLFLVVSLISGLITGLILFGRKTNGNLGICMLYSLLNIFGMLVFVFIMLVVSVARKESLNGKVGTFIMVFVTTYIGILFSTFALLYIPLL